MTEINPPAWMQAGSYPARTDRLILSALLAYPGFAVDESTPMRVRQGVKPSYQNYQLKARAAATPNMTVIVSAGFCFIDNHDAGGTGTYVCVNDGDKTLTVATAGGTGQYRRDCVVASVYDQETAGSVSEWRLEIIQGAYAASAGAAVRPSLPPNCSLIADITIGPNQTSVATGQISDVRNFSVASGGILPVSSSIAPNRMHPGQMQYRTDTDDLYIGTLAGPSRKVREVLRPVMTDQVSQPPTTPLSVFTDFTNAAWPAASVTVPPSGMVKITIGGAVAATDSATAAAWLGWKATGAFAETTNESNSVSAVGGRVYASRSVVRSGLTPGSALTVTPQWWSNVAGAGRRISNGQLILEPVA